jgi:Brix domain
MQVITREDGGRPAIASNKPVVRKAKIARILKKKEPQIFENTKRVLVIKGNRTSQVVVDALKDISQLVKPHCKNLTRKNEIYPFEDVASLEFLAEKNDCSLFVVGSHSKKRPNNLVLGRNFDGHVLDLFEFGLSDFRGLTEFVGAKKGTGSKPLVIFQGDQWDADATYARAKNLLLDFFRGDSVEKISLKGLDHVLSFTVVDNVIFARPYMVGFLKSGSKVSIQRMTYPFPLLLCCVTVGYRCSDTGYRTQANGTFHGSNPTKTPDCVRRFVETSVQEAQTVSLSVASSPPNKQLTCRLCVPGRET